MSEWKKPGKVGSFMMHLTGMFEDSLFRIDYDDYCAKWHVVVADALTGKEHAFSANALEMAAIFSLMFTGGENLGEGTEDWFYKLSEHLMPVKDGKPVNDGRRLIP